jgi:hypothetical protein
VSTADQTTLPTFLVRRIWLFPVATWVLLYAWRPFFFGFYHDDWSLLLGCGGSILAELHCLDASRPGAVLIRWAFHALVGTDPAAWQLITSLSMLGAGWTLMWMLRDVLRASGCDASRAACAGASAASFYLAFPWMLGVAWVNGTSPNVATILFNMSILAWFAGWPLVARSLASCLCFACASLIYEAYWFAIFLMAGLVWTGGRFPRRDLAVLTAGLAGVQLALIAFNRVIALLGIGVNKSIDANWLHTLGGVWPTIIGGLREIYGTSGRLVLAALLVTLTACLATRFDSRRSPPRLAAIALGIAVSLTLLASAGYVIQLTGLFARTTLVVSWWLAVAVALATATLPELSTRPRALAAAAGMGVFLMLVAGTLSQSRLWIDSWVRQQDILARLPRDQLLAAPTPSFLVVRTPRIRDGVGTFNAWYDISSAIWMRAPDVARHLAGDQDIGSPIAIAGSGLWHLDIAPTRVTEQICPTLEVHGKFALGQTLLWKYPEATVEVVATQTEIGCAERFSPGGADRQFEDGIR